MEECIWFSKLVHELFKIDGKIIEYSSNTGFSKSKSFKVVFNNASLAKILVLAGTPFGDKTKLSYSIPEWIAKGDSNIKTSFLRVLFNFDGSISLRTRKESVEINYVLNKRIDHVDSGKEFMQSIKSMLSDFGVTAGRIHIRHCNKDKFTLILFITNFKSIINFYRNVRFVSTEKNEKLEIAMSRIYRKARFSSSFASNLLMQMKKRSGGDSKAVSIINEHSIIKYTSRQFEHMRRGESEIPVDMLCVVLRLLDHKDLSFLDDSIVDLLNFHCHSQIFQHDPLLLHH